MHRHGITNRDKEFKCLRRDSLHHLDGEATIRV